MEREQYAAREKLVFVRSSGMGEQGGDRRHVVHCARELRAIGNAGSADVGVKRARAGGMCEESLPDVG